MVKNILFDFGNVFVDLDMEAVNLGIQTYVGIGFKGVYTRYAEVFDSFEKGEITVETFVEGFSQIGIPKNKIVEIWNSMIVGLPAHRIDFIKSLAKEYNIYLYSNINTLHETHIDGMLKKENGMSLTEFRNLFKQSWFSHHINMRKPDLDGFELIINALNVPAEEIFFIDDSPANVEAALTVGMKGMVHHPKNDIVDMFEQYIKPLN